MLQDQKDTETVDQQMQNLLNQIESNKALAVALDQNPAAVSNAITHLMLGGLLQGLQVLEVKINQLQAEKPHIFVP